MGRPPAGITSSTQLTRPISLQIVMGDILYARATSSWTLAQVTVRVNKSTVRIFYNKGVRVVLPKFAPGQVVPLRLHSQDPGGGSRASSATVA